MKIKFDVQMGFKISKAKRFDSQLKGSSFKISLLKITKNDKDILHYSVPEGQDTIQQCEQVFH